MQNAPNCSTITENETALLGVLGGDGGTRARAGIRSVLGRIWSSGAHLGLYETAIGTLQLTAQPAIAVVNLKITALLTTGWCFWSL